MKIDRTLLAAAALVILSPSVSFAQTKPFRNNLHSQCPTNNQNNSWKDYMAARFPRERCGFRLPSDPAPTCVSGYVNVQFRFAKNVNDRSALPNIDPSACYAVRYDGPARGYFSARFYSYDRKPSPGPQPMTKLPGDPNKYEINVAGSLLRFNEAGEVFNTNGAVVGMMVCYSSNECESYRY